MMIPKNIEIVGITYTAIAHRWAARDGAAIVDALHWYDGELLKILNHRSPPLLVTIKVNRVRYFSFSILCLKRN